MWRIPLLLLAGSSLGTGAQARDSLGVFDRWGAFRDAEPRCYAIAEPARISPGAENAWRPFASVGTWPKKAVRAQFHVRLSRQSAAGSKIYLSIGERRFALTSGVGDAWAQDRRMDAAIIAAMRSATTMSVEGISASGRRFSDLYALKGAATAMDAAAFACAR